MNYLSRCTGNTQPSRELLRTLTLRSIRVELAHITEGSRGQSVKLACNARCPRQLDENDPGGRIMGQEKKGNQLKCPYQDSNLGRRGIAKPQHDDLTTNLYGPKFKAAY